MAMARDDYFVLVYRLLRYLYACLKAGEPAAAECFSPQALGIVPGYWFYVMKSVSSGGYVSGLTFPNTAGAAPIIQLGDVQITPHGIAFLEDNEKMKQAAEFLQGDGGVIIIHK